MGDRFVLKNINVISAGKIVGSVYALIGLMAGATFTLFSLVGASLTRSTFGILFGVGAIIILPIFYGVIGFIGGTIAALIFNFVSTFVGGLEIELA